MKPCDYDSYEAYKRLIGPIREKARELGYAVAQHGTLKRDIDLIACPWTRKAVDAKTLADAIKATIAEHNNGVAFQHPHEATEWFLNGCQPFGKPHGRYCWSFHLVENGGWSYVDLSVMPRYFPPEEQAYRDSETQQ